MLALSLTTGAARAAEPEYPVSYVERPLTLPKSTLAPQLELDLDNLPVSVATANGVVTSNVVVAGMQLGASFGITPDLEVGAVVLPVQFNDGAGYGGVFVGEEGTPGDPMLVGTFRFLHRPLFDLGARLRILIAPPRGGVDAGALVEPSVPLLLHLGTRARIDAEVGLPLAIHGGTTTTVNGVTTTTGSSATLGLDVPVRLAVDILEPLHVGVSTGVRIDDFGDGGGTTFVPLGVFAGYAIGEGRPILDVDPFFSFYDFFTPGGGPFGDKFNPSVIVFGVSARGYFYF